MRDAVSQSNGAGAPAFPRRASALRISRKGFAARIEKSPAVPGSDRRPPVLQKAAFPAPFGRPHRSRKMLRHKALGHRGEAAGLRAAGPKAQSDPQA